VSSKAIERATAAANPWNIATMEDGYPSAFERSREEIAVSVLTAALDPDDKHLADAVIYPIQRALVRDWVYSEDLPTEIITALRDAILGDKNG